LVIPFTIVRNVFFKRFLQFVAQDTGLRIPTYKRVMEQLGVLKEDEEKQLKNII
jgi:hypothetical protein